jgi:hypothetical protein
LPAYPITIGEISETLNTPIATSPMKSCVGRIFGNRAIGELATKLFKALALTTTPGYDLLEIQVFHHLRLFIVSRFPMWAQRPAGERPAPNIS